MSTAISLIYSVLIAIGSFLFIFGLATFLTLRKNYSSYKLTYDAILGGDYIYNEYLSKGSNIIYFRRPGDNSFNDDEILFFENGDGSIKLLGKSKYIHNASFTYLDPYTLYWKKKIKNAMKEKQNSNLKSI
jgi:hypothetical protein